MRLTLLPLCLSTSLCWAAAIHALGKTIVGLPITFERNQGQWPRSVEFSARIGGHLYTLEGKELEIDGTVHLQLAGSTHGRSEGLEPVETKTNYLAGPDPRKWITGIPNYGRVRLRSAFPGIDLILYASHGQLEFDYVVGPQIDPRRIRLRVRGASFEIGSGGLRLTTPAGETIELPAPLAHQDTERGRRTVQCQFRAQRGGEVGVETGPFDHGLPLVIDPVLNYLGFVPGTDASGLFAEFLFRDAIVTDADGNFYLTGTTSEPSIPTTPGALRTTTPCPNPPNVQLLCYDAWVIKFSAVAGQAIWATYLGATDFVAADVVGLDPSGNVVVAGRAAGGLATTPSAYMPTLPPATGPSLPGFIAKLNPSGTALIYATYLPNDVTAMKVDSGGAVYFSDLATVKKLSADGSTLLYSTQIPIGNDPIAIDGSGNLYAICGASAAQPVSPGAYQSSANDAVFILKLDPQGNPVFTASFGGATTDALDIAVDPSGNIVFTGEAGSGLPVVNDPDPQPNDCGPTNLCAYVAALDSTGSVLLYSRLLGHRFGNSLAFGPNGDVYVAGEASGYNFPRTFDAFQYCNNPPSNVGFTYTTPPLLEGFVMRLDSQGRRAYSSYLGTSGTNAPYLQLSSNGDLYVAGEAGGFVAPNISAPAAGLFVGVIDTTHPLSVPHACLVNATQLVGENLDVAQLQLSVAPGQMVTLFGEGLGPQTPASAEWNADGSLANSLAGTQVLFDGVPAPMLYAQANQVNCIVPFEVAVGQTTSVVVQYAGAQTDPLVFHVAPNVLDPFTVDYHPGSDLLAINEDGTTNSADHPAPRGSVLTLFLTGLGQTTPPLQDGQIAPGAAQANAGIVVYFYDSTVPGGGGATQAEILYQGAAPGEVAGLYQLNVTVPANAVTGHTLVLFGIPTPPTTYGIQENPTVTTTAGIWLQ